tara:strand:- start:137 stop:523 length:387 start_codon:yes stop_codon:yes gene_type:complete
MADSINIKFPFKETNVGGVFDTNITTDAAVRADLVSLLTTRRGQRPMRSSLFSPIYDYLMEPLDDFIETELKREIEDKVREFLPQITITTIVFEDNENVLKIDITFRVDSFFGITDSITLNMPREIQY